MDLTKRQIIFIIFLWHTRTNELWVHPDPHCEHLTRSCANAPAGDIDDRAAPIHWRYVLAPAVIL